jgi:hypothetical protein
MSADAAYPLACTGEFDEHGIHPGRSEEVQFEADLQHHQLRIELLKNRITSRVRCLATLVCELRSDGQLASITVQDLQLPPAYASALTKDQQGIT